MTPSLPHIAWEQQKNYTQDTTDAKFRVFPGSQATNMVVRECQTHFSGNPVVDLCKLWLLILSLFFFFCYFFFHLFLLVGG